MKTDSRIVYLDNLKVVASFMVVILHISAQGWTKYDINSYNWKIVNIYDGIVRCAVPIFVMISGVLFLNKKIDCFNIYKTYISRLVIAYIFWSIIYAIYNGGSVKQIIGNSIKGYYHMWYIQMLIGIYIVLPILYLIKDNINILKYVLCIGFVFIFIIPEIIYVINDFGTPNIVKVADALNYILNNMSVMIIGKYSFYFLLGYYIDLTNYDLRMKQYIYLFGFLGVLSTIILTQISSCMIGCAKATYFDNFTVGILVESIAIFVLFKDYIKKNNIIITISKSSMGIYLVHVLFIEIFLKNFDKYFLNINPIFSIPVLAIIIYIASFIVAFLLRKIPVIGQYIA